MDKIFSLPDKNRLLHVLIFGTLATLAFGFIYTYCNENAASSKNLYNMYIQWELSIPLIPWMIYPYLSLNLLFVLAIFTIKELSAIRAYCLSIVIGAFIAGIIFYFFPGKLGFTRSTVVGYEKIFESMFSIDHPHNLFPSLHITYSSLSVWAILEQAKNKIMNYIMWVWLILIYMSVIFVHQHHLFDILTGALLAILIYRFFFLKIHRTTYKSLIFF